MFPDAENARLYGEAHRELTAMWERLTGRGNPAPVDADPAVTMLPASTTLDEQSVAYRGMSDADAVPDSDIPSWASRQHTALDPAREVRQQILLPEDYERANWDADRVDTRPAP